MIKKFDGGTQGDWTDLRIDIGARTLEMDRKDLRTPDALARASEQISFSPCRRHTECKRPKEKPHWRTFKTVRHSESHRNRMY